MRRARMRREEQLSIRSMFVKAPTQECIPLSETAELPLVQILRHGREVEITPALAQRIINEANYEYQRKVKPWKVAWLSDEIRRGTFCQGRQINFVLLDGCLIFVNGQNRLHAVIAAGKSVRFSIDVQPVLDRAGVAAAYATFDNQDQRSLIDSARHLCGDLNEAQVTALLRAVELVQTGYRRPSINQHAVILYSRPKRVDAARPWLQYANQYFSLISGCSHLIRSALYRQPVLAVALMTIKCQPEKAAEFWQGLAADDGLSREDPRKKLIERLQDRKEAGSVPAQLQAAAAAWNAFFEGRKLKRLWTSSDQQFSIAGTKVTKRYLNGNGKEIANGNG